MRREKDDSTPFLSKREANQERFAPWNAHIIAMRSWKRRRKCSSPRVRRLRCRYRLCSGPSWHVARTTAEARRSGLGLGAPRRCPSARFLPVSTRLPPCGSGARSGDRLNPSSQFTNSIEIRTCNGWSLHCCLSILQIAPSGSWNSAIL